MFGLGMMEIGLIIALAVMLFPPKELPKLARTVARIYGQVRKTAEDFRSAVLEDEDLRSPIDEIKGAYNDARWEVRDAERKARQQLAKAQMELRMATARRLLSEREKQSKDEAKDEAKDESAKDGPAAGDAESNAEGPSAAAESALTSSERPSPVRIATSEPEEDHPGGPVAASDPRVIAARRPPAYTPPVATPPAFTPPTLPSRATSEDGGADNVESDASGEPREGVA
jgi:Sec-independent protein translocase protein TatA